MATKREIAEYHRRKLLSLNPGQPTPVKTVKSEKPIQGEADKKERLSSKVLLKDLWGNDIEEIPVLKDRYSWYPVNVLYTPHDDWNKRRKKWRDWLLIGDVGIQGDEIEEQDNFDKYKGGQGISKTKIASEAVFDPMLLEVLSDWYCPDGGKIIDPFNGSHVSGCLFQKLGYNYTGIDIRQNIIDQNNEKVAKIIPENPPRYLCGDSNVVLDGLIFEEFDLFNSCPPYANLVKYSDRVPIIGDISLLDYDEFVPLYTSIIHKVCAILKRGGYATITIGQIRDKDGSLLPFREDTIAAFKSCGMKYWNDVPLIGPLGSAAIRAKGTFERGMGKLVNVHQIVLVFKKP
jgi:hypothetical protein